MRKYQEILFLLQFILLPLFLLGQSKPDLEKLILESESNNDSIAIFALNKISYSYWGISIDSSLVWAHKAVERADKTGTLIFQAQSNYNLAAAYDQAGDFQDALIYYLRALDYSKDSRMGQIRILNGIGILCRSMGEPEKAIEYYLDALKLLGQEDNGYATAMITNNLANAYSEINNKEKAEQYHRDALSVRQRIKDTLGIAQSLNNIGNIYLLKKEYIKAVKELESAEEIIGTKNGGDEYVNLLLNLGNTYAGMKLYNKSKKYLNKALSYGKKIGLKEEQAEIYSSMATLDSISGDFANAYHNLYSYAVLKDSILSLEKAKEINRLETQYRVKENERKIIAVQKENELKSIKEAQQSKTIIIVSIGLIIFSLLAIYLAHIYIQKRKANKLLAIQKEQITQKNKAINKALEEKELLIQEINHRAKNNLYTVERLLSAQLKEAKFTETKTLLKESQKRIQSISLLHNQLFSNDMPASVNMKLYINELLDTYISVDKNLQISSELESVTIDSDNALALGLILNELITNSIKHATTETKIIHISLKKQDDKLKLTVKDNNSEVDLGKVEATDKLEASFFGTELVMGLVKQLKGTIEHMKNSGMIVQITIPSKK